MASFCSPLKTSPALRRVMAQVERSIAPLEQDRYLAPDLAAAAALIRDGALIDNTVPKFEKAEELAS